MKKLRELALNFGCLSFIYKSDAYKIQKAQEAINKQLIAEISKMQREIDKLRSML